MIVAETGGRVRDRAMLHAGGPTNIIFFHSALQFCPVAFNLMSLNCGWLMDKNAYFPRLRESLALFPLFHLCLPSHQIILPNNSVLLSPDVLSSGAIGKGPKTGNPAHFLSIILEH